MERYVIKTGKWWEARYDRELNIYTALFVGDGSRLYEISEEMFNQLEDGMDNHAELLVSKARKLYMDQHEHYNPDFTIVFDEDYQKLAPWATVTEYGKQAQWPTEMVDAVVEVLASEENNRKQRREKKKKRESQKKSDSSEEKQNEEEAI